MNAYFYSLLIFAVVIESIHEEFQVIFQVFIAF